MLVLAFANNNMNIHRTLRSLNVCSLFAFDNRWFIHERAVCSKFVLRPITADAVRSLLETYLGNRTTRKIRRTDNRDGLGTSGPKITVEARWCSACAGFIVHSPHARTASVRIHIAAPRPSHQDSSLSSVAPGFTPAVSSSPRIVPPPILP